jgi:hypothetical protein
MPPSKRHPKNRANYRFLVAADCRHLLPVAGATLVRQQRRDEGLGEVLDQRGPLRLTRQHFTSVHGSRSYLGPPRIRQGNPKLDRNFNDIRVRSFVLNGAPAISVT